MTTPAHTVTLASGETHNISHDEVLRQLRELHEWYSGQEKDWYVKTYNGEGAFNPAYEREWLKYRGEAAALQVAINILSAEQPTT